MVPISGPVIALFALLAMAGIQKIADPEPTVGALRVSRLPNSRGSVRALGVLEMSVGVIGVFFGGATVAALGALLYLSFGIFVVNALVRELPIRSCGCFGAVDTPPTRIHVAVNLAAFVLLATSAFFPVGLSHAFQNLTAGELVVFLLMTGATVFLLYGVLAVLPLVMIKNNEVPIVLGSRGRAAP